MRPSGKWVKHIKRQCSYLPHWPYHQRHFANCDWMSASYTTGQSSNPPTHPTCWALSQWSHTVSRTLCHGAWTSAPLSTHPSIKCRCTVPQIKTPICSHHTATHQLSWQRAAQWADHQWNAEWAHNLTRLRTLIPDIGTPSRNDPPKKSLSPA